MVDEVKNSPSSDQVDICKRYNVAPGTPEDRVAVALHTLSDSPIYGSRIRDAKSGAISWFFYCGTFSEADDFFQPLHTDHLVEDFPEVVKYLYLPEGTNFIIDRSGYEDVWFE